MRTLLLSENFPPHVGGSGRWFWEIYRRLPPEQYAIAAGEHSEQASFDRGHDLNVVRCPLRMREWGVRSWEGLRAYLRAVLLLRRLVRTRKIGMVHCGRCLPEGVMALALRVSLRVPYLCFVHGEDIGTAANSREHALLVNRVLRGASCCIANSQNTARLLHDNWRIPSVCIQVLNPGVNTKYFVPAPRDQAVRHGLGWHDRRVVLTVGRLQRRKGQDMLIRALPAIREHIPDVLYSIVGDGEEREALQQLAIECDVASHVQFLDKVCDAKLLACYQQCDLFALPNREIEGDIEGFGMVLVEAQSCGKPVLAGRSGGTAETMSMGLSGEIVDCETPAPLARLVIHLLNDAQLLQTMGRQARRWVVEHFDWDTLVVKARELFESQFIRQRGRSH
jgi:phosphatidylinositol alpha-1,6-mannosyltransferase